jgi:DNA replication protein DnaC
MSTTTTRSAPPRTSRVNRPRTAAPAGASATPAAPAPAPGLPADLEAGLRRLKLSRMRSVAPELLATAKLQRWTPEEVLRTLIEAELTARDASNAANRLKAATFPVHKTLGTFDVSVSSIPAATFDYLASLEWIRNQANLAMVGPAGTGKSHTLIGLGVAAVAAGHKVRYFSAADLVENLYRAMADNTVGKTIESILRNDLVIIDEVGFAPLDDTGTQNLFRLVAAAYERRSLAIGTHWAFQDWGRFLPEHTTAVSILDRLLHHATVVATSGQSYRMRDAKQNRRKPPTSN